MLPDDGNGTISRLFFVLRVFARRTTRSRLRFNVADSVRFVALRFNKSVRVTKFWMDLAFFHGTLRQRERIDVLTSVIGFNRNTRATIFFLRFKRVAKQGRMTVSAK